MRGFLGLFGLVMWACTPGPEAPPLDAGTVLVDAAGTRDAGSSPQTPDAARPVLRDSGQAAYDAERPSPGQVDAGFRVPVSELPDGDVCAGVCAHTDCQEECLIYCRLGEVASAGDQRSEFVSCMRDHPCDYRRCWPDSDSDAACREICSDRDRIERCSIDFLIEADQEICPQVCMGMLARMEPANRQAWLDCSVNVCRGDRHIECNFETFMGPTPSATCLEAGRNAATCPGSHRHYFAEAWECEGYRSPIEQRGLGGAVIAECLAETHSCGDMRLFECMTQAQRSSGRSAAIQELCSPVAQCDDELVLSCRMMATGMTPMLGHRQIELMGQCIAEAGSNCNALERCVDFNFEEMQPSANCEDACSGCGRGDWGEQCLTMCNWMERSLSVDDAYRFGECVGQNSCNMPHQFAECARLILPEVGRTCREFWRQAGRRCPSWRDQPSGIAEMWCMLSGVRTGVIGAEALNRCGQTIGCELDPIESCLKGRLGG